MTLLPNNGKSDAEEGRRRREEGLEKKRREGLRIQPSLHLPSMVAGALSDDNALQLDSVAQFRKLLSLDNCTPATFDQVTESGVVPRFVQFLQRDDSPQLQHEAAWALTNIASGTSENTRVVVEHGAVPLFVKLLNSPSDDVREQSVWALGNIAGDSPKYRDLVLSHGVMIPLLSQYSYENVKLSMLKNATWTLSNLCRGRPEPDFEKIKLVLPVLQGLIHSDDEEVLTNACWVLSCISNGANYKIEAVIEANVCARVVDLLLWKSPSVILPALRTVGNIVMGDDVHTQCIINHQALPCLLRLLTLNHEKDIQKEACWAISNITAGNKEQIQAVIAAGIIGPLVDLLETSEIYIKKEAAWGISNAISGGSDEQVKYIVSQGCIRPLCDMLVCPDPRVVNVCLEALDSILKVGEVEKDLGNTGDVNVYAHMIDEAEDLYKIEYLQSHDNVQIFEKAVKILGTYFLQEDDETLPPGEAVQADKLTFSLEAMRLLEDSSLVKVDGCLE